MTRDEMPLPAVERARRSTASARSSAGLVTFLACSVFVGACSQGDTTDVRATLGDETAGETADVTEASPDSSSTTEPTTTFGTLASAADFVLGPIPLDDGRQFAVLGHQGSADGGLPGSLELIVETESGNWENEQTITGEGTLDSIATPADLDNDGVPDIQSDWFVGANTNYGRLHVVDPDRVSLEEIEFARGDLNRPMDDFAITSVEPGFVVTSIESCDPDCATGGSYNVTWRYDPATSRLVVHSQPDAPSPDTPAPADPLLIPAGVIDDGVHYGYLVSVSPGAFSFDKADVLADGSWKNVNPKVRTLPYAGSIPWSTGTPIEILIQNQRVTSVSATTAPPPPDPLLIPPGVIEDGYHVGYLVSQSPGSISFDKAEILPDGSWQNVNPKVRTLPVPYNVAAPNGAPIELYVENQRVLWVVPIGG